MAAPRSTRDRLFLGRWFQDEVIIVAVRWYLTYPLSYRQICEMLHDRGISIAPSTGEDSGAFMAADSTNGKVLWHFQTSQSLRASPMTYMFDNQQYVALASGSNILVFGLMN